MRRCAQRSTRLGTSQAISQLSRVDDRLLATFGHLAERWGRMTPRGVCIHMALTQQTLGQLVGAARPTVSLALKELYATGALSCENRCEWTISIAALRHLDSAQRALTAGSPRAPGAVPGSARPALALVKTAPVPAAVGRHRASQRVPVPASFWKQ